MVTHLQQVLLVKKNNKQVLTDSNGGGNPHNNLQPYQVVGYMWIRTA